MTNKAWLNISGTTATELQLGINGPAIAANNGNVNVINATTGEYTNLNAANVIVHNNTTGFSVVLGVPDNQTSNTLLTLPPNDGLAGQFLSTDGTGNASWADIPAGGLANGTSAITIPAVNGNVNTSVGGNANVLVVTSTGIEVTSNILAGNANITANLTTGNLAVTTDASITGNLLVSGDQIITGNLDVLGSLNTTSTNSFSVVSPIIELGTGPNGDPLTTNDGMDRGILLDHYDGAPVQAFMGLRTSTDEFIFGARVSNVNNVITVIDYGNIMAATVFANLEGNVLGALVNGTSNVNIAQLDGNITVGVNGTPNILTVADTGIVVTGDSNISGNLVVSGLTDLGPDSNIRITGGSNGQFLRTDGTGNLQWAVPSGTQLVNGNSNVVVAANSTVTISSRGVANVVSISDQAANITGNLRVTGVSRLGVAGNVFILGGAPDQFLKTDGNGNLTWSNPSAQSLVNGSTSLTTETDGNIVFDIAGVPEVFVVTPYGTVTTGNAAVSGNITTDGSLTTVVDANIGGNLAVAFDANIAGLLTAASITANNATVTSNLTIANLAATGNATFSGNLKVTGRANLGAPANITITGGSNGQVLRTDGAGNLSWVSTSSPNALSNGNSNVVVSANSNIAMSVGGFANRLVVTAAGIEVTGTSNLGNVGNVKIGGGSANFVLQTDGTGNLQWVEPPAADSIANGTSNVTVEGANGVVTTSVDGVANVLTVRSNGILVTGTATLTAGLNITAGGAAITGNITVSDTATLGTANVIGDLRANNARVVNLLTTLDANITGNLITANANVTTLLTAAQANVTGNITAANATVTGLFTGLNANITANLISANANITTLLTAANANVTGNLHAGNANVLGNLSSNNATVTANLGAGNANIGGSTTTVDFTATGNVVLGAVGDITITGGNNLQVLTTDGAGNLTWKDASGGSALIVKSNGAEIALTANTLDFTGPGVTATANGNIVTVEVLGASAIIQQTLQFTATSNANGQSFTDPGVSNLVSNSQSSIFVNGVLARPTDYTISGTVLTFNRILKTGDEISAQPVNVTMSTPQTGISNGNSSVVVTANGNITLSSSGTDGVLKVASTGIQVTGNTDLGTAANLRLAGGNSGQVLTSTGAGDVAWREPQIPGSTSVIKMTTCGFNGMLTLLEDGRLYLTRGQQSGGYVCYYDTMQPTGQYDSFYGVEATHEILQPYTDTGKIIDAGVYGSSAYMLMDNGNLYTWGYNGQGQLGVGDTTDRFQPTLAATSVAEVYTDSTNSNRSTAYVRLFIRKNDGTIWGCGYNNLGALGIGNLNNQSSFVQITLAGTDPMSVWNLGGYVGCLVVQKSDGTILVAGYNGTGQLGNNTTTNIQSLTAVPAWQPPTADMVLELATGGFGYSDNGAFEGGILFMWYKGATTDLIRASGSNNWGSLATGNFTDSRVPVAITIPGTGRIQQFSAVGGAPAACHVLRDSGRLYAWGYNALGQLGVGNTNNVVTVTFIMTDVLSIELANQTQPTAWEYRSTSYIKKADGYYSCGQAYEGQTGTGAAYVSQISTFTRMRLPAGITIAHWGRNTQNNTRWNIFMVDTLGRWWACGWSAGYAISNQPWIASQSSVPSPFRVMPYNLLFNRF